MGTRISEETAHTPKPLIHIGGKPILWHIMKHYSFYGFNDFIILLGYRGYMIKDYFINYYNHNSDITVDLTTNQIDIHKPCTDPWKITLLDTGLDTLTGGRILRAADHLRSAPFMLTYGDGLSTVNLKALAEFHASQGKLATITATYPMEGRFGALNFDAQTNEIHSFNEKPISGEGLINGGYMVLDPAVLNYITDGDATPFERAPLEALARDNQLCGFRHDGFWQCMDTLRDKNMLERLWASGNPPWRIWPDESRKTPLSDRRQ